MELLRDSLGRDVALPRPHDVLDVQAVALRVPGPSGYIFLVNVVALCPSSPPCSDLLPLELMGGPALHPPPQVHDVQLDIVEGPGLSEPDVRLPGLPGSGARNVSDEWNTWNDSSC